MAGGSADAAAALARGQRPVVARPRPATDLTAIGAELGSDVPFALAGGTALGYGRGERLTPVLTQAEFHWVFALQRRGSVDAAGVRASSTGCATGESRARARALRRRCWPRCAPGTSTSWQRTVHNDLQDAAVSLLPRLREVIDTGHRVPAPGPRWSPGPVRPWRSCARATTALDLMVTLSAGKVADDVVRAVGPAPGAHVVTDLHSVGPA